MKHSPTSLLLFLCLVAMVLVVACAESPGTTTEPGDTTTTTDDPTVTTTTVPDDSSQTPEDAARDGVLPAVAALPFDVRVGPVASIGTPEGTWVVSRLTPAAEDYATDCRLGAEYGEYPVDFICTFEYGEILLIKDGVIVRAYPLPGVPAEHLAVTDDAVFCARNGEGMLPDSMVCRIDRTSLVATVRIFPGEIDSVVVQPCFYPPAHWDLADHPLLVTGLVADGRGIWVEGVGGPSLLDPQTLEPVSDPTAMATLPTACIG